MSKIPAGLRSAPDFLWLRMGPTGKMRHVLRKGLGGFLPKCPPGKGRCRKGPSSPEENFCAQPLPLSLTITGACGGLPRSVSKAAACGVLRSFGPAALEKSCVKKPGRPDGLPGFLRASGSKAVRQTRRLPAAAHRKGASASKRPRPFPL